MALGTIALLLSACSSDPLQPKPDEPGGTVTGVSGGGTSATIVGTWQNVVIVHVAGDVQTWTTTWRFDAEGTCRQTSTIESVAQGFPSTIDRACTFVTSGTTITISYINGGTLTFDFTFTGPASNILVLDGSEYQPVT